MLESVELALALIPRWVILAVGLVLAVLLGIGWTADHTTVLTLRAEIANVKAERDGERAANALSKLADGEEQRKLEQKWAASARAIQESSDAEITRLNVALAASAGTVQRMRNTIDLALRTIRSTGRDSTPAEVGAAADALAGVLRSSIEEYRALGRDAAISATHGTECEQRYDSLTTNPAK